MGDDTISRQDAIDAVKRLLGDYEISRTVQTALYILPPAQPEERTEERTETHACDLISRQAAVGAIVAQTIGYTADEIKAECEENIFNENGYLGGLKDAIEAIEDMPSAQPEVLACGEGELIAQPEIVQCEDCRHWEQETFNDGYCTEMDLRMCDADFYCGYAERRTDERQT